MIVIRFGRWNGQGTRRHHYERIYWKGWRWTPLCRRTVRYTEDPS